MSVTAVPIRPTPRRVIVYVWLGIVAAVVVAGLVAFRGTAAVVAQKGTNAQFLAWNAHQPGVHQTASGLEYKVLTEGEGGQHPTDNDTALVNYRGTLRDGTEFNASRQPTPLPVGNMVKGFSEGLKLMSRGATYRLWIKPELGYGDKSPDPAKIPNGSLLVFDVQLLGQLSNEQFQQLQMQQMLSQQGRGAPSGAPGGAPGQ